MLLSGCYLAHVADGQLRLLRASAPIARVVEDPGTSDDERRRLGLVLEARDFARGLGLDVGEQYTSYARWPGDRLVTAVVATRPGSLEPAAFWFPVVGEVPYKSYFDRALAEREADELRAKGLDVCLAAVPAYSTLGWFPDPVTGPLLRAPEPDLVATVVHELVHATVYVPGDADWNEGLATFVGQEASVAFFSERGGVDGETARYARSRVSDSRAISAVLSGLRSEVAALYEDRPPGPERDDRRRALSEQARERVASIRFETIDPAELAASLRTNDACLALEGTYAADLPRYENALAREDGDLRRLVEAARRAASTPDPRGTLLANPSPPSG
ncbi:hypothetical protein MYXO_00340 [Myxococcaceae bacterium]|nr:hypothetical protein MYXO_00340 [Myxococcaceae bacterium]